MGNGNKLERLESLTIELVGIIDIIRSMDTYRQKYGTLISDQKLMTKYNKKWIAFSLALDLYRILLQDIQRFVSERQGVVAKIRPLDPELAKRIELLELPSREELAVLEPIDRMLGEDPALAINYLNIHYQEIMQQLRAFNDKETAYELRRIMILLSGEEIAELNKCINDIRRWLTYRLTNRIDFFTDRLQLYVRGSKGTKDEISGEIYLGLASNFKDVDLVREMFKIPEVKKLWTYKEEIQFFRWAASTIKRSLQEEGKWEGFYEFYNNLRRGKKYIEMVREKFGNIEFADFLERLPENVHENPQVWEADLEKLSKVLENPNYQNKHVIEPAQQVLLTIFNARIQQLLEKRRTAVTELKAFLDKKISEIQNAKLTTQKNFVRITKKKKKKILAEWERMKSEFEIKEKKLVLRGSIYLGICDKLLEELHLGRKFGIYYRLLDISMKWINFMKPYIERSRRNIFGSLRLRAAATRLDQIEDKEFELMYSMANPNEIAMLRLERLILEGNENIVPRFADLINNIKTKLEKDFTIDINSLENLKLEPEAKQSRLEEAKKVA